MFNNEQLAYLKIKFRGKRRNLATKANVHYNTVCAFLEGENHNEAVAQAINDIMEGDNNTDTLLKLSHTLNQKLSIAHA